MCRLKLIIGIVFLASVFPNDLKASRIQSKLSEVDSLSDKFLFTNPDSSLYYSLQQKKFAKEAGNGYLFATACYKIGYAYYLKDIFDMAVVHNFEGLNFLQNEQKLDDEEKILEIYFLQLLGVCYEKAQSLENALSYYSDALEKAKAIPLETSEAILLYNLGVVYEKKEDFVSALKYYFQSLKLNESLDDELQQAVINNSIGNVYNKMQEFGKAKEHYLFALRIALKNNLQAESATYISNLGENAFKQNDLTTASDYYQQALNISENIRDTHKIMWINSNLADVYVKEGKYESAIAHYSKSIDLSDEKTINEEYQRACKGIAFAYESIGNYKEAVFYKNKFLAQTELLAQTKDKLQAQNAQYRMKEVEWQMERLAKNEQILFYKTTVFWFRVSLSLIILVLFMISYFTYKYYRKIAVARRLLEY